MLSKIVAKRYAQAFIHYKSLTEQDLSFLLSLDNLVEFMSRYRSIFFHANTLTYKKLLELFNLATVFDSMIDLLVMHKRLFLFKDVLEFIVFLYKKNNLIESVSITSSHELRDDQKKVLHCFLEQQTGKKIIYSYAIKKSLIAGIRARGSTFVWESSIAKRLRRVEQSYQ